MKLPPSLAGRWNALAAREKALIGTAGGLLAVALVWWLGLAGPLNTLRTADASHRALDVQLGQMTALQAQAQAMLALPRMSQEDARRALESSVRQRLGATAQISMAGERATVTLRATPADALAQWLAQVRINARALPLEARLVRSQQAGAAAWDGSVVLSLPAR